MIERTFPRPPTTTGRVRPRDSSSSAPSLTSITLPALDRCAFDATDPRLRDAAEILLPLRIAGTIEGKDFQPAEAGLAAAIAAGGCHLLVAGTASGKSTLLRAYAWRNRHPTSEGPLIRYLDLAGYSRKPFGTPPDDPIVLGTSPVTGVLVDGYAQMEHSARPTALGSLLELLRTPNKSPAMLIACRSSDMDALRSLLPVKSVIELMPPDDGEIVKLIAGHSEDGGLRSQEMIDVGLVEVARQPKILRVLLGIPAATLTPAHLILRLMRVVLEQATGPGSQLDSLETALIELVASHQPPYSRQELSDFLSCPELDGDTTVNRLIDSGILELTDEGDDLGLGSSVWHDVLLALGLVAPESPSPAGNARVTGRALRLALSYSDDWDRLFETAADYSSDFETLAALADLTTDFEDRQPTLERIGRISPTGPRLWPVIAALKRLDAPQQAAAIVRAVEPESVDPDLANEIGEAMIMAGEPETALSFLEPASLQSPITHRTRRNLAVARIKIGDVATGRGMLEELLKNLDSQRADVALQLAPILQQEGRIGEARALLESACQFDPTNWRSAFALGRLALRMGDNDQALEALARAADLSQGRSDVAHELARAHFATGDLERARSAAEKAVSLDPSLSDPRLLLGEILAQAGQLDSATEQLEKVTDNDPHNAAAWHNVATLKRRRRDLRGALRASERAISLDPTREDYQRLYASLASRTDRFESSPLSARTPVRLASSELVEERYSRFDSLLSEQSYEEARSELANLKLVKPADGGIPLRAGILAAREGSLKESLRHLERALRLDAQLPTALLELGQVHERLDDLNKAEVCFRQCIQKAPDMALAWQGAIRVAGGLGKVDEVRRLTEGFVKSCPDSVEALLAIADLDTQENKLDEVQRHLDAALVLEPNNLTARLNRATISQKMGRLDPAIEDLSVARSISPDSPGIAFKLADASARSGRYAEAVEPARRAAELAPTNQQFQWLYARTCLRLGYLKIARNTLIAISKLCPNDPEVWRQLGLIALDQGNAESAIGYLVKALERSPDDSECRHEYGLALAGAGRFEDAIREMQLALRLDHQQADWWAELAEWQGKIGDIVSAATNWRKAAGLQATSGHRWVEASKAEMTAGNPVEALVCAHKAAGLLPRDLEVKRVLALALEANDRRSEAIDLLRFAVDQADSRPDIAVTYGEILNRAGDHAQAVSVLNRLPPDDNPSALLTLGRAYAGSRQFELAASTLQESRDLAPDDASIKFELAGSLVRLERFDSARGELERAVQLDPHRTDWRRRLAEVQAKTGDLEAAISTYELVVRVAPEDVGASLGLSDALFRVGRVASAGNHLKGLPAADKLPSTQARRAGYLLTGVGLDELAAGYFHAALLDRPHDGELLGQFGDVLLRLGRFDEARPVLEKAAGRLTDDRRIARRLAEARLRCRDPIGALAILNPMVDSGHSSAEIASLVEEARAWSDDGESALPALERLIDQRPEDRSLRKRYAECLLETEKLQDALDQYRLLLIDDPDSIDLNSRAALVLVRLGNYEEAVGMYRRLCQLAPASGEFWLQLARLEHRLGNVLAALEIYERELDTSGTNEPLERGLVEALLDAGRPGEAYQRVSTSKVLGTPAGRVVSARAAIAVGKLPEAVDAANAAVSEDESSVDARLVLARAHMLAGRSDRAAEHFELANAAAPLPLALAEEAHVLALVGRSDDARRKLAAISDVDRDDPAVLSQISSTYRSLADLKQAESAARLCVDRYPDHADGWTSLAALARDNGELEEATEAQRTAVQTTGANWRPLLSAARFALATEDLDWTDEIVDRLSNLTPDLPDLHSVKSDLHQIRGDLEQSLAEARRAAELSVYAPLPSIRLANLLLDEGKDEMAGAALMAALASGHETPELHYLLGAVRERAGAYDDALTQYRAASKLASKTEYSIASARAIRLMRGQQDRLDSLSLLANRHAASLDDARRELESALEADPDNGLIHSELAQVHAASGRNKQARKGFERAVEVSPNRPEIRAAYGRFLVDAGLFALAIEQLERAVEIADMPEDRIELGRTLLHQEQPRAAIAVLGPLLVGSSTNIDALVLAGRAHSETGDWEKTVEYLAPALSDSPGDSKMHSLLGQAYYHLSRVNEAQAQADQAIEYSDPPASIDLLLAGECRLDQGDPNAALEVFKRGAALYPTDPDMQYGLARVFYETADYGAALEPIQEAIQIGGLDAQFAVLAGKVLVGSRELQQALRYFELADASDPSDAAAVSEHGKLLFELERYPEAKEKLTVAIELGADGPDVLAALGRSCLALGQLDEATTELEEAVRVEKDNLPALTALVQAYRSQKRTQAVVEILRQIAEICPSSAETARELGAELLATDRPAEAVEHLNRAVEVDPNAADWHEELGRAYLGADEPHRALSHFHSAIELNPGRPEYHRGAGIALKELHKYDDALNEFRRALKLKPDYAEVYGQLAKVHTLGLVNKGIWGE